MAKSKFEYVREFENHEKCLPNCWIVVRVDGKAFHKFAEAHKFQKPNDSRSLKLMTSAATAVMKQFLDVILAYGQSDEYSFVFRKDTSLFNRRVFKISSSVCSTFTAYYQYNWREFFGEEKLIYPPTFDARTVLYPSDGNIRDYLSWRQADVHINNLYNTCFWNLIQRKGMTNGEAEERLKGTVSSEKNELLYQEFGINYNNEPEEFRRGTTIVRKHPKKANLSFYTGDIIGNKFWEENSHLLASDGRKKQALDEVNVSKSCCLYCGAHEG